MKKKSTFLSVLVFILLAAALSAADLEILYKCVDPNPNTQQILLYLNIINNSDETIPMSQLQVRYYYTKDSGMKEVMNIDYAMFGSSNLTYGFAEGFLELGFTSGAGTIISGNNSGEIQLRFHKTDWSAYNQSNDFSSAPANEDYAANPRIALFRKGTLVWGSTPSSNIPEKTPDNAGGNQNLNSSPTPKL